MKSENQIRDSQGVEEEIGLVLDHQTRLFLLNQAATIYEINSVSK